MEKQSYLLEVSRYIVLNPVRAGAVRRPGDWVWSSFLATAGETNRPAFLTVDWILDCFDAGSAERARRLYRQFVAEGIRQDGGVEEIVARAPVLGGEGFVSEFRAKAQAAAASRDVLRRERFVGRPELKVLFKEVSDKRDRDLRMWQAYTEYGYTLSQIAACTGLHYTTVSKAIRLAGRS